MSDQIPVMMNGEIVGHVVPDSIHSVDNGMVEFIIELKPGQFADWVFKDVGRISSDVGYDATYRVLATDLGSEMFVSPSSIRRMTARVPVE